MRVLVSGAIANKHRSGGAVWTRLSWVLGLQRLGVDVCFVEELRSDPVDANGAPAAFEDCVQLARFRHVARTFGFAAALIAPDGQTLAGMTRSELLDFAGGAVLVNISGHLRVRWLMDVVARKIYIDQDPGYTQFWHADGADLGLLAHDVHFTVGENLGASGSAVPLKGIRWRPLRQPVVLDEWPVAATGSPERFTTVGSWRGAYGAVEHGNTRYGVKAHEFRKFLDFPRRVARDVELAIAIDGGDERDRASLCERGWRLVDPARVASDPWSFREYIQGSGAEFSVAQGLYVEASTGWFSDRSTRYLASGKPVLVQDTGFSRNYPVGEGLLAFRTLDEAIVGAERIAVDYGRHSRAARAVAEQYFDSQKVLSGFLDQVESN